MIITTGILQKKKTMWFIGAEVEQETSAPPPKKYPGSAPVIHHDGAITLTNFDRNVRGLVTGQKKRPLYSLVHLRKRGK